MNRLLSCAVGAITVIGTPVLAADMAVKAPPPVAPVAPVANWTGFYVGGVIGGATFDPSCSNSPGIYYTGCSPTDSDFSVSSFSSSSFVGGGKIGYNWEVWSHAVVGEWGSLTGPT
jgi:outer membrane immunogenic protein